MTEINFLTDLHTSTTRDYLERVVSHDKAHCAEKAKEWGYDYWDGERQYGFGGYKYDGRWLPFAQKIASYYDLKPGDKILEVGCGKAFLLYEFTRAVPGIEVHGLDISKYGIENSKEEIRDKLTVGNATDLPYEDGEFDFVFSLLTLHNLKNFELMKALKEIQRVGKDKKYICVESYRNEKEKMNLLYWQLTCETFYDPEEWKWFMKLAGYDGDDGYIYFE